ncbi:MAG: helix-turn-helix domain-containing protein [Lachnospiraceae bacterium]
MTFGARLEELRKKHHMTQGEMGEKFGICASTLSNYERGIHQPDLDFIIKVSEYFQVSIDYLFGRTEYEFPIEQLNVKLSDDFTAGKLLNVVLEYDSTHLNQLLSYVNFLSSEYAVQNTANITAEEDSGKKPARKNKRKKS